MLIFESVSFNKLRCPGTDEIRVKSFGLLQPEHAHALLEPGHVARQKADITVHPAHRLKQAITIAKRPVVCSQNSFLLGYKIGVKIYKMYRHSCNSLCYNNRPWPPLCNSCAVYYGS